jgi:predicted O-methyltransferase YrrM
VNTLPVIKAAIEFGSREILEVGSDKGSTARLLAKATNPDTNIWTLDMDPNHGKTYLGTVHEDRIHRIIGKVSDELLAEHGPFDLIFVDADHDYDSVFRHSTVAFKQLAANGVILWHDYQQLSYLHGGCAVPEALHAVATRFAKSMLSIEGTMLGIYSEASAWESRNLRDKTRVSRETTPWADDKIRSI